MEHGKCAEEPNQNFTLKSKFINELSCKERQNFLDSFDVVFTDCDGVIWESVHDFIPGSAEAIDYLQKQGKQVRYVTNNSLIPIEHQLRKFQSTGLNVEMRDIVHPAQSVCDHLKSIEFDGLIYAVTSSTFRRVLQEAGFKLIEEGKYSIHSIQDLREFIHSGDAAKAVIIDVDVNLSAAKLMRAHIHLKDPTCLFIGGASDPLLPLGDGDIIGPGLFISLLESATKRKALVLGKPGEGLRDKLLKQYKLKQPERALFIGDSLTADIKFGKMCGFQTLLVLSGGTRAQDLQALEELDQPDYIADGLASLNGLV